ncbi:hypothetical protein K491DRAFT_704833 [Lophiostoma macrostomum CBS 122681]|uniref:Protein YAE1 n=1 Tax=Lophiostoma macrostomum CBS 122681 TaxID=1314788 RepID=A0A6A6T6Z5_9PLEO|nr:hypothetical protein K491DRAFT_704833 [Lophiostoma macrostomum CBS 122681]
MLRDSPPFTSSFGNAPPSPPSSAYNDPLDDIYGSAPASPTLPAHDSPHDAASPFRTHEILSDLPSRQRALDTDAYREGLANSKGQYVQEGFDEGYSLGANLGLRVGYVLGVLQGFAVALAGHDQNSRIEVGQLAKAAQKELAIEELLGQRWVDDEGIWKWDVRGKEDDPNFREVADQHPVVKKWDEKVKMLAQRWDVDLHVLEREDEGNTDEQS